MTSASAGIATSLPPTARITPRATTTVASSIGGPETGTTFAPRIAKYCGSPPCAEACEKFAANKMIRETDSTHQRERFTFMRDTSDWKTEGLGHPATVNM